MRRHIVAAGETLLSITSRYKLADWQAVWLHPANAALRQRRGDPMVLAPGDVLIIPAPAVKTVELATDARHRFRLRSPRCTLTVTLEDEDGRPHADCAYELEVAGQTYDGRTSPVGRVSHAIPVDATEGTLRVTGPAGDVFTWHLKIGHLDPLIDVADIRGVQARLNNLGYGVGPVDGELNERTRAALKEFQQRLGYAAPTAALDRRTLDALAGRHRR